MFTNDVRKNLDILATPTPLKKKIATKYALKIKKNYGPPWIVDVTSERSLRSSLIAPEIFQFTLKSSESHLSKQVKVYSAHFSTASSFFLSSYFENAELYLLENIKPLTYFHFFTVGNSCQVFVKSFPFSGSASSWTISRSWKFYYTSKNS